MRLLRFQGATGPRLGVRRDETVIDVHAVDPGLPNDVGTVFASGASMLDRIVQATDRATGQAVISLVDVVMLTPIAKPEKILCIGMNYVEHVREAPIAYELPSYPVVFLRTARTLVAHGQPLRRPVCSTQFDFEGELVCVIGRAGRNIPKETALDHVGGWSLFNDASVRDYQFKSQQWTMGKNFDSTGAFEPEVVSADELPPGANGLRIKTVLNGQIVQSASTSDMIFNVATQISLLSEAMTLVPGDLIVTGTPSGVGLGRKPPLWMKHGDTCSVSLEGVGVLSNPVFDE